MHAQDPSALAGWHWLTPLPAGPTAPLCLLQLVFLIDQAEWPRATDFNITVTATNDFGESNNSTEYRFTTPL